MSNEVSLFWDPTRYIRNQVTVIQSPAVVDRAYEILEAQGIAAEDIVVNVQAEARSDVDGIDVTSAGPDAVQTTAVVNAVAQAYGEIVGETVRAAADNEIAKLTEAKTELTVALGLLDERVAENPDDSALQAERASTIEQLAQVETRIQTLQTETLLYGSGIQLYIAPRGDGIQIGPRSARTAAIAFVLAGLAAGAFAWWRSEQDMRAETKDSPAAVLNAPLLAVVPEFELAKAWAPAPTVTHPHTAAAEAYQFALSSLSFVLEGVGGHSVLITSPSPEDGKTAAALNLAVAAMRDGRSPLLVDADERVAGLTKLSGVELPQSANGAVGHGVQWPITPTEHIDFIAAGRANDGDTAGYFRSTAFRKGLHEAMAGRDLVIIDSPPVMSASETADLAREVDGVVMVIREDAKLSDIADARERLSLTGTPILGYIYNRSSQRVDNYTYRSAPPAPID